MFPGIKIAVEVEGLVEEGLSWESIKEDVVEGFAKPEFTTLDKGIPVDAWDLGIAWTGGAVSNESKIDDDICPADACEVCIDDNAYIGIIKRA